MKFGAAAVIFDPNGRVLLVEDEHDGTRHFAPPGGSIELGETPREAAVREVVEECGLPATVTDLLGVYVARAENFSVFVFMATVPENAVARADTSEVIAVGWFDSNNLPSPRHGIAHAALEDATHGRLGMYREV